MARTKLFRVDVKIAGTAYIKATSKRAAAAKLKTISGDALHNGDELFCEYRFADPRLPEISLSPAMTLYGRYHGALIEDISEEL